MPKITFNDSDNIEFTLLPRGDYPFEVVSAEFGIQSGGKTNGCDYMDLKCMMYAGPDFKAKAGTVHRRMIFHQSCEWVFDTLAKCTDMRLLDGRKPAKGDSLEFTEDTVRGLRGWCKIGVRKYRTDKGEEKEANEILTWYTDKAKFARNTPAPAVPSVTAAPDDDVPF